jgi:hypothetical protein
MTKQEIKTWMLETFPQLETMNRAHCSQAYSSEMRKAVKQENIKSRALCLLEHSRRQVLCRGKLKMSYALIESANSMEAQNK